MAGSVLELHGLSRSYADLVAFSVGDLALAPGELVALMGPNGAGKSTFLRLASGLLEPSDGSVAVDGAPAGSLEARASTSYLPDAPVLYGDLSVLEQLEYVARLHGTSGWEDRAEELLDRLGLADRGDDLPATFSRGMRQKAAIALAFIRPFSLLLADEPFDGLDPASRAILTGLVTTAVEGGASAIVSTHRLDFLEQATRCLVLFDGAIAYDGPADEVAVRGALG
jgi:ABC-2 type transport system ATP-binding protein